jgi:serine/threonine protein kinase
MKNSKGGNVLASGGYGCVFSPALRCEGTTKREKGKITKLLTERHAKEEYAEIISIKEKLDEIPNYKDYFLIYDINLCKPEKLTKTDLKDYSKCKALLKEKITDKNINKNLDDLLALNMPNGGLDVEDYIYSNGSFEKIYKLHISLMKLLKEGIVKMNEKNIYHADIKDSNVLVDDDDDSQDEVKSRLIDWGLSNQYKPFTDDPFPKSWRNRPFQFNVPFSVIIFSEYFIEKYTDYIKNGGTTDATQLKAFVIDYINFWVKKRGAGHYKLINEIMFILFSKNLTSISSENMPKIIETQITMVIIVNYIVDVLVHFTKFKKDGTVNLREYLDNIFIRIVDIWGFICVYYPILELLYNNYENLTKTELNIFNKIKVIFVKYLYTPRHTPIELKMLYSDLNDLGNLIYIKLNSKINRNKKRIKSVKISRLEASGIHKKTKKNKNYERTTRISFKRRPKAKRFKNPFFLSLK